jgi:hypothetical protein
VSAPVIVIASRVSASTGDNEFLGAGYIMIIGTTMLDAVKNGRMLFWKEMSLLRYSVS